MDNLPYYEVSQIEQCVLGVCFVDSITLDELVEFGVQDWWSRSTPNKLIWNTMLAVRDGGEIVDVVNTCLLMEQAGDLAKIHGGPGYVAECAAQAASASQGLHYARTLRKYVKLRMLNNFSQQLRQMAEMPNQEPETVMQFIKEKLDSIETMVEEPVETLSDLYTQVFAEVTRIDRPKPFLTPLQKINFYIGGLYPQEFTILAGESGAGKTAMLCSWLDHINKTRNAPVALFSLEMGNTILAMRVLSSAARMQLSEIRAGNIPVDQMYQAIREHASEDFYVKTDCWAMAEIEATTRVLARTKGVETIGIDFIQIVEGNTKNRNREQEIAGIGRSCKKLSKDLGIHVVGLSQLDDAWDGVPTGRNLRESKALKHHADNVLILWHPDKKNKSVVRCNIEKGRNSRTGIETLGFIGGFTEFVDDAREVSYHTDDERMF